MFGSFDGSRTSSYVAEKNHISFQQTCSVQKSSTVALPVVFRSSEKFYCLQSVQKSRSTVIMSDSCEINRNHHGAPHRSCCSLTRMSRPATGKKTPGELSAGDRERNPSKQFQDCFLRSQHSATIYPERFQEQRIVDRARGPVRAAAAIVVEAADGGGRRRGGHLGLVLQQHRRGR